MAEYYNYFPNPIKSCLGGKGHTKIQVSAEPGSNQKFSGRKAEILSTAPTMPALIVLR